MPIIYSLVSRGATVLAEHATADGNFIQVSRVILDKIQDQTGRMSYTYDRHFFHYSAMDGLIILCMSDLDFQRRIAFAFLDDIRTRFVNEFGSSWRTAMPYGMNSSFSKELKQQMRYFSYDPNADKLTDVQNKLSETKSIMVENIDRILERGERIEILVDRASELSESSFKFTAASRKLKWAMCRNNLYLYLVIIGGILFLIWFIASLICGFDFRCVRK
eukprot:TRINITY_DN223_c0_g1_i2.p1 TRINITY_DN223_c0_g1~~TRINITY_DN223_c0_g1_i2.p1  ORF type:complete len:219 (+),score=42.56 TRINITY_DN223_c0_g1_i2:275-931(+)